MPAFFVQCIDDFRYHVRHRQRRVSSTLTWDWDGLREMEGGNGHPFPHVEAVGVTSLYPRIEVQDGAGSLPRSFQQVGEQLGAYAFASVSLRGNEVIDRFNKANKS